MGNKDEDSLNECVIGCSQRGGGAENKEVVVVEVEEQRGMV